MLSSVNERKALKKSTFELALISCPVRILFLFLFFYFFGGDLSYANLNLGYGLTKAYLLDASLTRDLGKFPK